MADRIDLITEQIDSIGLIIGIGKNIDDTTSDRILTRLIDKIDPREVIIDQGLLDRFGREGIPHMDRQDTLPQPFHADHTLDQRFGIGTEHQIPLREGADRIECGGTLYHAGGILLVELDRTFVGCREEEQPLGIQKRSQVVVQITGPIPILHDEDMNSSTLPDSSRCHERIRRADQRIQSDDGSPALQQSHQLQIGLLRQKQFL